MLQAEQLARRALTLMGGTGEPTGTGWIMVVNDLSQALQDAKR
jgi:hypothetical protein